MSIEEEDEAYSTEPGKAGTVGGRGREKVGANTTAEG